MRRFSLAALALSVVLAACALTPRQQCEAPYQAELRTVETEIRSTELNLRRGFTLVPARWPYGVHYCLTATDRVTLCTAADELPMYDKQPINRVAEMAKLRALLSERRRLAAAIQQCAVQFPE